MLTSHPLLRRFENDIEIGPYHLEWTTRGRNIFFRLYGTGIKTIWCWTDFLYSHSSCPVGAGPKAKAKINKKFAREFAEQIETPLALRFWPVSEQRELYFCSRYCEANLGREGWDATFKIGKEFASCNRLFSSPDELQEIVESLKDKFDKAESAFKNASEGCQWLNVSWHYGTNDQLVNLLKAMGALIRQPCDKPHAWRYIIKINFPPCQISPFVWQNLMPEADTYEPFLHCLRTHFPLKSDALPLHRVGYSEDNLWPSVKMSSGMPTQHEKIEALLTWRDFLRDKIPAAQIDELLRPFC